MLFSLKPSPLVLQQFGNYKCINYKTSTVDYGGFWWSIKTDCVAYSEVKAHAESAAFDTHERTA